MRKPVAFWFAAVGAVLVIAFFAWAFSQHGTVGLFKVNGFFRLVFIIFGALAVVLIVLALLLRWLRPRNGRAAFIVVSVVTIILSLPAVIVPVVVFVYAGGVLPSHIGDTPPQLFIADGTGANGVPDIAVTFTTAEATRNTLAWGAGDTLDVIEEEDASRSHVFMLRDLEPDTTYTYQVNNALASLFTTPPAEGPLRFAVASDAHYGGTHARNDLTADMLALIGDPDNDYRQFFFLGDLVEYGFVPGQWRDAFTDFSAVTAAVPVRYTAGNHDTVFAGFAAYKDWCYPEGMDLATGSRLWYRVDTGNVHFLVLDVEWSIDGYTDAQATWLEEQLASIPAQDWTIVMSHGFYYASGLESSGWNWYDNPETIDVLTPLFTEYGVDLVFSGHNHRLELLQVDGVTYVLCAGFGGLPDPAPEYASPASLWEYTGGYAYMDVTIIDDQCRIIFRGADGATLYEYTLNK